MYFGFVRRHGSGHVRSGPGQCLATNSGYQCPCGQYLGRDGVCHTGKPFCTTQADCAGVSPDSKCVNNACTPGNVCLPAGAECGAASYCCENMYCATLTRTLFGPESSTQSSSTFPVGVCVPTNRRQCDGTASGACPEGQVCVRAQAKGGAYACANVSTIQCTSPVTCNAAGPTRQLTCDLGTKRCAVDENACADCGMPCQPVSDGNDPSGTCCPNLVCAADSTNTYSCKPKDGNTRYCGAYLDERFWRVPKGHAGYCEKRTDCKTQPLPNTNPDSPLPAIPVCDPTSNACVFGCNDNGACPVGWTCLGGVCYPDVQA